MFKGLFGGKSTAEQGDHDEENNPSPELMRRPSFLGRRLSGLISGRFNSVSAAATEEHPTPNTRRRLVVSQSFSARSHAASSLGASQTNLLDEDPRARALTNQYERDITTITAEQDEGHRHLAQLGLLDLPADKQIWIESDTGDKPWELGEVVAVSKDKTHVTVLLPETGQVRTVLRTVETRGFDHTHLSHGISDLGMLNDLHEASTLSVLEQRFLQGQAYTSIGHVLISVNPFEHLPNAFPVPYTAEEPHLFQITKQALEDNTGASHSILINGESGAGKTESTKQCMRYLSQSSSKSTLSAEGTEVRRAVAQTTPLLEAFGNARTLKNHNSSRFGRYVQILLKQREICGSMVSNFLIEANRVTNTPAKERNFHVFYYLVIGLDSKRKQMWHLHSDPNAHAYLTGFTPESTSEDDELAKRFLETSAALESVGASDRERQGVWSALAFILRLGDIKFTAHGTAGGGASEATQGVVEAASILELPNSAMLSKALTVRRIETGRNKEVTEIPMDCNRAAYSRDGLARALYTRLFDWIVARANEGTKPANTEQQQHSFIGVLDMMGFEVLAENSFEQLLINYSSEILQAVFNDAALAAEKLLYMEEGVDSSKLQVNDNSHLLQLFSHGIFSILDDITMLNGTDDTVLARIADKNKQDGIFCLDQFNSSSHFIIKHFAGPVQYSVINFVEKNKGSFFNTLTMLMVEGKGFVAEELFHAKPQRAGTVSKQFRDSLADMMQVIKQTRCHFVRCIRPNMLGLAKEFDSSAVNDQLLRLGVYEAVRLRREGFPIRVAFEELPRRYPSLMTPSSPLATLSAREQCEQVLLAGLGESTRGMKWQLGTSSQAFLSARAFLELDLEVHRRVALEELRVAKLARAERERLEELARLERERLDALERARLAELKRLADEEAERVRLQQEEELRLAQEREALRLQKLEEERKMLERVRAEELAMRLENERIEALRAKEERQRRQAAAIKIQSVARMRTQVKSFALVVAAERARFKEMKRQAKEKQLANEKARRERAACIKMQAFIRGALVRKRYWVLKSMRQHYLPCLRANEIVVKESLVVRAMTSELLRAADNALGANGKFATAAMRVDGMQQKKRYQLLLTRTPRTSSLLLVDCKTLQIKDEMIIVEHNTKSKTAARGPKTSIFSSLLQTTNNNASDANSHHHHRLIAVSTSSRDFVVAKHKAEWSLSDLQCNALSWVALLKDDGKLIPTTLELLTESFYAQDKIAFTESETSKIIVKQGELLVKRVGLIDKKVTYVKRWLVLDEEKVQIFNGQSNPFAEREILFSQDIAVRVEDAKLFVLALMLRNNDEGTGGEAMQLRMQAPDRESFDSWLVAFGVAANRGRQENQRLLNSITQQQQKVLSPLPSAAAGKKKFDANAFKSAFKDTDRATMTNRN